MRHRLSKEEKYPRICTEVVGSLMRSGSTPPPLVKEAVGRALRDEVRKLRPRKKI